MRAPVSPSSSPPAETGARGHRLRRMPLAPQQQVRREQVRRARTARSVEFATWACHLLLTSATPSSSPSTLHPSTLHPSTAARKPTPPRLRGVATRDDYGAPLVRVIRREDEAGHDGRSADTRHAPSCSLVPIQVVLVDDVAELRGPLKGLLHARGGFEVVAEAADGVAAIDPAKAHQPVIVVLDLGLPDLAGHEVLTALRRVSPAAMIAVDSGSPSPDSAVAVEAADTFLGNSQDMAYVVDLLNDVSHRTPRSATLHGGPGTREVPRARRFAVDRCRDCDCTAATEDISLVVSELVANALVHRNFARDLTLGYGGGMPEPKVAALNAEHGRGLMLVTMRCVAWGTEPRIDGKCVWADLLVQGKASPGHRFGHGSECERGPARYTDRLVAPRASIVSCVATCVPLTQHRSCSPPRTSRSPWPGANCSMTHRSW